MNDFDDNNLDEDDALDYIIYEEQEGQGKKPEQNAGCLGLLLVITIPSFLIWWV